MNIGKKIKELRKGAGLSQRKLAEKIGTDQRSISAWEIGRNDPTVFNCIAIADYFGVTLDELCRG
jgi:transcriptional regulator with XRE-family HTH domain